jgi:hypothetical protein
MGNNRLHIGYLFTNQSFAYDFVDSLFQRKAQVGSAAYHFQIGNIIYTGELANSSELHAMLHSMQWGTAGFRQRLEYYQSDAYFPSWFHGNILHTPNTFNSFIIRYQADCRLNKSLDMKASFSYEKRDVYGTNNISKQYLKLHYQNLDNSCMLTVQHRTQPSSVANDSTLIHNTMPLDILRLQYERNLNSEWNIGMIIQDKYYQTNSGTRKHGFYLVNSFNWHSKMMKTQLQIMMLQTKSSMYINDDLGLDAEQWQMGDDLSYRLYVQIMKKIPLKVVYKGSFWKRGMEVVEVEASF